MEFHEGIFNKKLLFIFKNNKYKNCDEKIILKITEINIRNNFLLYIIKIYCN
jgi:hypothetical protein